MAERDITRGKWVDIENEDQFNDCIKYGYSNPKFKRISIRFDPATVWAKDKLMYRITGEMSLTGFKNTHFKAS